jgi:predicted nucleic acid-binding Zn finger protein
MRNEDDIKREIERLKLELEAEELKSKIRKLKDQNEIKAEPRVPVQKQVTDALTGKKSFVSEGIKFYEIKENAHYQAVGSNGLYDIILAKRTGDHLYCGCPDMKFRGFKNGTPCKHEKALVNYLKSKEGKQVEMDGFKIIIK